VFKENTETEQRTSHYKPICGWHCRILGLRRIKKILKRAFISIRKFLMFTWSEAISLKRPWGEKPTYRKKLIDPNKRVGLWEWVKLENRNEWENRGQRRRDWKFS
jgi:hypothetical protein